MTVTKTTKMKNYIPRRMYRERGQPEKRQHLGILEKNKDYRRRAANYKQKDSVIKKLSLQAQLRNPDEYYHGMSRMKRDDKTGKAVNSQELTLSEKTNQRKARKIDENSTIALVNLRR